MKYVIIRHILLVCFTLAWLSGSPMPASAAPFTREARFSELTVVASKKSLLLFAQLNKSITPEMREALHSGIPLEFTFSTELLRTTQGAVEQLQTSSFTHTIEYNTLTEEYRVQFAENHNRNNTFPALYKAVKALESINGVAIIPTSQLLPNNNYQLRIKADLFHKSLPPKLESLLPFLTWDKRKTEWQTVDFSY